MRAEVKSLIVDTDVGADDLMAIAFLLSRADVRIEAITTANGLCHVKPGAEVVRRLLTFSERSDIPVYIGRETPLQATAEFPPAWRHASENISADLLPRPGGQRARRDAVAFLVRTLKHRRATILSLGPLTNIASALRQDPTIARNIERLVVMGGAIAVRGNLADGGLYKAGNSTAEWNIFVDPLAARVVFHTVHVELVPLDATAHVPIQSDFVDEFQTNTKTNLGRFVAQLLQSIRPQIAEGYYQAWDPLAAEAVVDPSMLSWQAMSIDVVQEGPDIGRTVNTGGRKNASVAINADTQAFKRMFFSLGHRTSQ